MKKALIVLVSLACVSPVLAQAIEVSANAGILSRSDFSFDPLVLSGNITLDIHLGGFLMLSPECTIYANSKIETDSLVLAPGGTLNFNYGQLFLGSGIVKELWLKDSDISLPLELKIQAGIRASRFRLAAYMLTVLKEMFQDLSFGFTIGIAL